MSEYIKLENNKNFGNSLLSKIIFVGISLKAILINSFISSFDEVVILIINQIETLMNINYFYLF